MAIQNVVVPNPKNGSDRFLACPIEPFALLSVLVEISPQLSWSQQAAILGLCGMATEWIHELTVVKLRDELKARELPTTGKKVELVKRLEDFLVQEVRDGRDDGGNELGEVWVNRAA